MTLPLPNSEMSRADLERRLADLSAANAALQAEIAQCKQAEESLHQSEHHWRRVIETMPQLVWTATPDGTCDYFSPQWRQHTGIPEEQLLGWLWLQVLHPDDRERTLHLWRTAVEDRAGYDLEYRVRRSDSVYRWFKTRGVPIRDGAGQIVKWFGTCTDITEGKQLVQELCQANSRLDLAVRGANVGIWEIDMPDGVYEHGRAYHVNLFEQLGYDRRESPTQALSWMSLVHPEDKERVHAVLEEFTAGQLRDYEVEYRALHQDENNK